MDPMAEIRLTFFEECAAEMRALAAGIASLAAGQHDAERVAAAFRAAHSIKGGAASFRMRELTGFALTLETVLRRIRDGALPPSGDVAALLGRATDTLQALIDVARDRAALAAALRALVPDADLPGEEEDDAAVSADADEGAAFAAAEFGFAPVAIDMDDFMRAEPACYRIRFAPDAALYRNGNESARLIREVAALGAATVRCDTSAVPRLDALDPEGSCLAWEIELTCDRGLAAIEEIFEFASFDCALTIEPLADAAPRGGEPLDFGAMDPETAALFERLKLSA